MMWPSEESDKTTQDGIEAMMDFEERRQGYFLSQDNDCHWYVVPQSKRAEWEMWVHMSARDDDFEDAPKWATPVNGSPSRVVFMTCKIT